MNILELTHYSSIEDNASVTTAKTMKYSTKNTDWGGKIMKEVTLPNSARGYYFKNKNLSRGIYTFNEKSDLLSTNKKTKKSSSNDKKNRKKNKRTKIPKEYGAAAEILHQRALGISSRGHGKHSKKRYGIKENLVSTFF